MSGRSKKTPRGSKMVYGPEDGPGQIIIMDGVTYVANAQGVLLDAGGNPPPDSAQKYAEISAAMADPVLGVNPTGNPYSGRMAADTPVGAARGRGQR